MIPDDPLKGATRLWAQQDLADEAHRLAAASGRDVEVMICGSAFPGRIYGFNGKRTFLPCFISHGVSK